MTTCSCGKKYSFQEMFGGSNSTGTSSSGEFGSPLGTSITTNQTGIDSNSTTQGISSTNISPGIPNISKNISSYSSPKTNTSKFNNQNLYNLAYKYNTKYIEDTFPSDIVTDVQNTINTRPSKNVPSSFYGLNRSLTTMKTIFDNIKNNIANGWTLKNYRETDVNGEKGFGTYAVTRYDTPTEQNVEVRSFISPKTGSHPVGLSVASTSIPTLTNILQNGYDDDVQIKDLTEEQLDEYKKKFASTLSEISDDQSPEDKRQEILTKENYVHKKGDDKWKMNFYLLFLSFVIIILSLKIFINR